MYGEGVDVGEPGWVGRSLSIYATDSLGARRIRGRVWLDGGEAVTDLPALQALWSQDGLIGRGDRGRLFPSDGQAFLDELPFAYRSACLQLVPDET